MSGEHCPRYSPQRLTSSGQVKPAPGVLGGFLVASQSSGTVTLYDSLSGAGTIILNTMNLSAGENVSLPVEFSKGCYAVIGGTADITFYYA